MFMSRIFHKNFDVNGQAVRNCLKESMDKQSPGNVRISELEVELKDAKKKLSDSELAIDILEKAKSILAQK